MQTCRCILCSCVYLALVTSIVFVINGTSITVEQLFSAWGMCLKYFGQIRLLKPQFLSTDCKVRSDWLLRCRQKPEMSNVRWEVSHWRSLTEVCFVQSLIPNCSAATDINPSTGAGSIPAWHLQGTTFLKDTAPLLLAPAHRNKVLPRKPIATVTVMTRSTSLCIRRSSSLKEKQIRAGTLSQKQPLEKMQPKDTSFPSLYLKVPSHT